MRRLAIVLLTAAFAAGAAGPARAAPAVVYVLYGSVVPGHITMKGGTGQRFLHGRPGFYRITISDRSPADDFRLVGPGVNVVITRIPFVGAHTVQVTLKRGTYRYLSDSHRAVMRGSFVVF